jgi:hypothetical protein
VIRSFFRRLFAASPEGEEQQPPTLEEVIDDAIEHRDFECILRMAPDVGKRAYLQRAEIAARVNAAFGLHAWRQFHRAMQIGEAA